MPKLSVAFLFVLAKEECPVLELGQGRTASRLVQISSWAIHLPFSLSFVYGFGAEERTGLVQMSGQVSWCRAAEPSGFVQSTADKFGA